LNQRARQQLDHAMQLLPSTIGRTFPDDYVRVADVDHVQLWRPTDGVSHCAGGTP
jgi:phage tail protein X